MRTVVCTFNVPDDYTEDDGQTVAAVDLIQGLVARLDEVYAANNGEVLVPQDVRVAVVPPEAWKWVLDGVDVHLDARAGDEDKETRGAERLVRDMRVGAMRTRAEMTEALRKQGWTDVEFSVMDDVDLAAELDRPPALPHAGTEGGHKWCSVGRHAVLPDRGRCPDHGSLVEEWD